MAGVNQKWIILIVLYWIDGVVSVSISGTIEDDISFYYEELSAQPSTLATIAYSIWPGPGSDHVDVQLYTTSNHVNIQIKCTFRPYSQVYNIGMLEHFQKKDCNGSNGCSKVRMIQDYIPRIFSFSLGNGCHRQKSLKGTKYKVDVIPQTNETSCFAIPDEADYELCLCFASCVCVLRSAYVRCKYNVRRHGQHGIY